MSLSGGLAPAGAAVGIALAILAAGIWYGEARPLTGRSDPWSHVPERRAHVDHAHLLEGPFARGEEVTRACLSCHEAAAHEVMATSHWTWLGQQVQRPGDPEPFQVGKANLINNFCIGVQPNLARCTSCHAGYGWQDASFDFSDAEHVDCLVCHVDPGLYGKDLAGEPAEGVDLLVAARAVAAPTRATCGSCHFMSGGGDAIKHGDLDSSLTLPSARMDVHMGAHGMTCQDCHRTRAHDIPGCSLGVCMDRSARVACTDCHDEAPHGDQRLDDHTDSVACQSCHIPAMATDVPTKLSWDWSQAGRDDVPQDHYSYLKYKGRFVFGQDVQPEYRWYDADAPVARYITGDPVVPGQVLALNTLCGSARDPGARIWPVKVHRGRQPYDTEHHHLLIPKTYGEGGYWTEYDWDQAFTLAAESTGLAYSGHYGWLETEMVWPLSHLTQPGARALQCQGCHGEGGRMDWEALGYEGDPAFRGGRARLDLVRDGAPLRAGIDDDSPVDPVCSPREEVGS
ncbi:MAG: tetrathionate reductase family octaheme c-type cytochrome [Pseudomonadota bacterium]